MNNTIIFGTIAGFMTCGALIMLALRAMLLQAPNQSLVFGLLAASFPIHIVTLVLVWRALERG